MEKRVLSKKAVSKEGENDIQEKRSLAPAGRFLQIVSI